MSSGYSALSITGGTDIALPVESNCDMKLVSIFCGASIDFCCLFTIAVSCWISSLPSFGLLGFSCSLGPVGFHGWFAVGLPCWVFLPCGSLGHSAGGSDFSCSAAGTAGGVPVIGLVSPCCLASTGRLLAAIAVCGSVGGWLTKAWPSIGSGFSSLLPCVLVFALLFCLDFLMTSIHFLWLGQALEAALCSLDPQLAQKGGLGQLFPSQLEGFDSALSVLYLALCSLEPQLAQTGA